MPLIAKTVLQAATTILQDGGAVRWPLTELLGWLNEGLETIAMISPAVFSENTVLVLVQGTKQALPDTASLLLRAIRNVDGPVITPVLREILDTQIPNWHSTTRVPFSPVARHIVQDKADRRTFYVFPGNDGTGQIEVTVAANPPVIAAPADPFDIDAYTAEIGIDPLYRSVLVNYILHRAFSKDMDVAGNPERAAYHLNLFEKAIGLRQQIEMVANVNTTGSAPNS
ncbi:DUF6682 family protein [Sagittula salina]|uniref:Uncharacterized protein n=1 Tax=Sagittula salina TaxID=2820268 RepID=A0A940S331_9RHOB|nr:DUF6682 family protein [Sagittula salina]MBP0484671.1 hypothetical protein [Sagittula salina]